MPAKNADNLTRDEARVRAALIDNLAYTITLNVSDSPKDELFATESIITFDAKSDATTFIDLTARNVTSLVVNGDTLEPDFNGFRVSNLPVRQGRNEIRVAARAVYGHTGVGMHRVVDPVDGQVYLYTHCEPFDAHKVYACFDQPDLKANFSIRVDAPDHWHVVSNYPEGEREGSMRVFETTPKLSTYLAAVIAGPYQVVRSSHGDIPLGVYLRTSLAEHLDPDEFFDTTRRGLDFYNDYFDYPYPFKKYDQLLVPEFNVGAMEHPGAVTFNEMYVFRSKVTEGARARRAHTILHEMAHMWFGDLVTMRWWDDLWLNESFAEYMAFHSAAVATRWKNSWVDFANSRKQWAIQQDQLPSTHPVVADIVDTESVRLNFDGITYAKGGSVLRQLAAYVGDTAFRDGIRQYFKDFAWSNASLADFLAALSKSSGRDLEPWSQEWLQTAGIASLRPLITSNNGVIERIEIEQTAPESHPTLRSHRLRVGLFGRENDGSLVRTSSAELDVVGARTPVPQLSGVERPDLLLVNDGDLAFAKVRLDDRSIDTVVASLSQIDDPLTRALCYSAAWDMTRDGELAARRFVDLVCAHAATESEIVLLERLMAQALRVVDVYGDPGNRLAARRQIAAAARRGFAIADRGTDVQLAWARGIIAASDSPSDLAEIKAWLEVDETSGLKVDTDLRWAVVGRLAAAGTIGEAEIDAEHERDPSDIGRRRSLASRASRPLPEAKREAWDLLTGSIELPLQDALSLAAGFSQPDQTELLEPFVEEYRLAIPEIWDSRDAESAIAYTHALFPDYIVSEAVLDMADSLLASTIPVPAKRIISESKDQTLRSARARVVDKAASEEPVA